MHRLNWKKDRNELCDVSNDIKIELIVVKIHSGVTASFFLREDTEVQLCLIDVLQKRRRASKDALTARRLQGKVEFKKKCS